MLVHLVSFERQGVEDCVDTMDDPAHHDVGLMCIRTAFGFVLKQDEILASAQTWGPRAAATE
jgi:hypothetical protein